LKMLIIFHPIGIIHTPFKTISGMPIQPSGAKGVNGTIELKTEFVDGLKDLEGFSHLILLYYFHKSKKFTPEVVPFLDSEKRGLFASRAPNRPNPIGLSVVALINIVSNILHIENVDILDKTPLLDIKPYIPIFDKPSSVKTGWLEKKKRKLILRKSDDRFQKE
jgi:tRNA-Thr(GGU) m(6)t(6)A37 methyltransferase TsaA